MYTINNCCSPHNNNIIKITYYSLYTIQPLWPLKPIGTCKNHLHDMNSPYPILSYVSVQAKKGTSEAKQPSHRSRVSFIAHLHIDKYPIYHECMWLVQHSSVECTPPPQGKNLVLLKTVLSPLIVISTYIDPPIASLDDSTTPLPPPPVHCMKCPMTSPLPSLISYTLSLYLLYNAETQWNALRLHRVRTSIGVPLSSTARVWVNTLDATKGLGKHLVM